MGRPKGSVNKKTGKVKACKSKKLQGKVKRARERRLNTTLLKPVETLQSYDFGFSTDLNKCFRAEVITIKDEPYFGFIKCWRIPSTFDFNYTHQRLFMPMAAWMHFMNDVLPLLKFTPPHDRYLFLALHVFNRALHVYSRANYNMLYKREN